MNTAPISHSAPETDGRARWLPWLRRLLPIVPVGAAILAFEVIRRLLREHSLHEILADTRATPPLVLLQAVGLTAGTYLALSCYDRLALRSVRQTLPRRRTVPISVMAYGVGNALGYPLLTSGPLRFRLYSAAGLGTGEIFQIISFVTVTFWLGLATLAGVILVLPTGSLAEISGFSAVGLRVAGAVLLGVVLAYLVATRRRRGPLRFRDWRLELPTGRLAIAQVAVGALDWLLTASVLWALYPREHGLGFATFVSAFLLAQMLGILSHVPGGLGVFEASLIAFLSSWVAPGEAAVALLLFRIVYYFLPLVVALVLILVSERRTLARAEEEIHRQAGMWLGPLVPPALAVVTFLAGGVLLVSGSLPAVAGRLHFLSRFVPLGVIETSHVLSTVLGLALLVLARGLARRLDGAWHTAIWGLGAGIVTVMLRGLDWEEASVLTVVFALLLVSRRHFYRRASLLYRPFTARWLIAMGVVLAGGVWLGSIAHGNADFSNDQLWSFSLHGDVPRFLRAQVAVAATMVVLGLARLFRGAPPRILEPSAEDLAVVRSIVARSPDTTATLALLGDKHFLFDAARTGFVMFGISGESWIAMGDPVGPPSVVGELIWSFRERCDVYDGRPVFYQIRPDHLALYLEAGLSVIKLGETARVDLEGFSLEGSDRKPMRQRLRKGEREGLEFEVVPPGQLGGLVPELRRLSDEWLEDKGASEKGFSLGSFQLDYLVCFPCALVRRTGRIVAFANLPVGADKQELSVDLMRFGRDAPPAVMDYLFAQLLCWGHEEGFAHFSLGMAPLAGLDEHALAPAWNRLGAWLFRHGEHFYNFQGLRAFKAKYTPVWEPRYLAAPEGLATSRALFDVARLIAGGVRGLLLR